MSPRPNSRTGSHHRCRPPPATQTLGSGRHRHRHRRGASGARHGVRRRRPGPLRTRSRNRRRRHALRLQRLPYSRHRRQPHAVVIDNVPVPDRVHAVGNFADTGRGLIELGLAGASKSCAARPRRCMAARRWVAWSPSRPRRRRHHDQSRFGNAVCPAGSNDSERYRPHGRHRLPIARRVRFGYRWRSPAFGNRSMWPSGRQTFRWTWLDRAASRSPLPRGLDTTAGRIRLTWTALRETRDADIRALIGSGRLRFTDPVAWERSPLPVASICSTRSSPDRTGQPRPLASLAPASDVLQLKPTTNGPMHPRRSRYFGASNSSRKRPGWVPIWNPHSRHWAFPTGWVTASNSAVREVQDKRDGLQTNLTPLAKRPRPSSARPSRCAIFRAAAMDRTGHLPAQRNPLWWQGGPTLSPGIRYEYYDLSVLDDPLFASSFPDADTTELSTSSWLPRLGLVWPIGDSTEFFAQYARGLRAPPFGDVNIGLELAAVPGKARLPIRTSSRKKVARMEAGLRWRGTASRAEAGRCIAMTTVTSSRPVRRWASTRPVASSCSSRSTAIGSASRAANSGCSSGSAAASRRNCPASGRADGIAIPAATCPASRRRG
jgi:hemoglobin/transferrin/lactoferrin receptor protein